MDRSAKIAALNETRDELIKKIANLEYDYSNPKEHITRKRGILKELEGLYYDQFTIEDQLADLRSRSDSKLTKFLHKILRKE